MKQKVLISVFIVFAFFSAKAQYFADYQLSYIKSFSDSLIVKLDMFSDIPPANNFDIEESISRFSDLFTDPIKDIVYNDIKQKPKFISVFNYTELMKKVFPQGLSVSYILDSAVFYLPQKIDDTTFIIHVKIPKYLAGLTQNSKIRYVSYMAYLTIQFNYSNYNFTNFKLTKINDYRVILNQISDKKMRGLHVGFSTNIYTTDFNLKSNKSYYQRTNTYMTNFGLGASLAWFVSSHLALGIGANFLYTRTYSKVTSDNSNIEKTPQYDSDSDLYYLFVNSDLEEIFSHEIIALPISLIFKSGLYNKTGIWAKLSVAPNYLISSELYVTGNSSRSGYYPEYNLLINNLPDYGFGNLTYNNKFPTNFNKLIFTADVSLGVAIHIKSLSYLILAANYSQSISPIGYKKSIYLDDYYTNCGQPKNLSLKNFGITLSYNIKL